MSISIKKFIDITSSVAGNQGISGRELISRYFTNNALLPTKTIIEFTLLSAVGTYFGQTSEEYLRAQQYFNRISKNNTYPDKLSFARWTDADTAPYIVGMPLELTLTQLKTITTGAFSMTLGSVTNVISGLDFSGASTLAAIAAIIQAAIRTKTGTQWTAATVTYDSTRGCFNFTGGSAVSAVISVQAPGTGTDITESIGWLPQTTDGLNGAIWSDGALEETITTVLTDSSDASNNFATFLFMPDLTIDEVEEAAAWTKAAEQNNEYAYSQRVSVADAPSYSAALKDVSAGTAVTLSSGNDKYPDQNMGMIAATTDYDAPQATQNYMFQEFGDQVPSVTTTSDATYYDSLRINYLGQIQEAGRKRSFYQDGVLMGPSTSAQDMNTYINEIWLKDRIVVSVMSLFLNKGKVSANTQGRAELLLAIQTVIDQGLINGVISVGKILSADQKAAIKQITGINDDAAWLQVQNTGYWLDVFFVQYTASDNSTRYKAKYTLIYSKDDIIRKVEGRDILI